MPGRLDFIVALTMRLVGILRSKVGVGFRVWEGVVPVHCAGFASRAAQLFASLSPPD